MFLFQFQDGSIKCPPIKYSGYKNQAFQFQDGSIKCYKKN